MTGISSTAYAVGCEDAKVAFLGDLYQKYIKGNVGPLSGGLFMGLRAPYLGLAAGLGQAIDTPKEESTVLNSLGVAGGAVATNALVQATVPAIVTATANALGLKTTGQDILRAIGGVLGSQVVMYGGQAGRSAARHLDQFLKEKGTSVP